MSYSYVKTVFPNFQYSNLYNSNIYDNLNVSTTTTVNSSTVELADNTLLLNSGPGGSRDSGIMIKRDDISNNTFYYSINSRCIN